MNVEDWAENILAAMDRRHPNILRAVDDLGPHRIGKIAIEFFSTHPHHRVLLGLLGGPSTGRYGFDSTAGKNFPRMALRLERSGKVSIGPHSGRYAYFTLPYR